MSQRRTRYTFTAERAGETYSGHVLAYDPNSVTAWLERRGYYNIDLSRVPRRRVAHASAAPTWEIDQAALRRLQARLGVTWRVEIRRTAARGHLGVHRSHPADYGLRHRICIDKCLSPERASEVIAHELTHAAQTEAAGSMRAWVARMNRENRLPYKRRPIEVEARANEPLGLAFMPAVSC